MNKTTHPYFVPNGDSRHDTAILLVGTADEYGIDQRDIRMTRDGFRISQAVADALGLDTSDEDDYEPQPGADEDGFGGDAPEPAEQVEPEEVEPEVDPEAVLPYDEWDYADLKAEVAARELDTEDKKSDTLVAALTADDETRTTNASGNRAGENEE